MDGQTIKSSAQNFSENLSVPITKSGAELVNYKWAKTGFCKQGHHLSTKEGQTLLFWNGYLELHVL